MNSGIDDGLDSARVLLAGAPIGAAILQRSTMAILYCNRALESILGYTANALLNQPLGRILSATDWPFDVSAPGERAQFSPLGLPATRLTQAIRHDGVLTPVEVTMLPYPGDHEALLLAYITDLSSVSRLQQSLRQLLNVLPLGVLVSDEHRCIVRTNPALEEQFGYGPGDLTGQRIEALLPQRLHGVHGDHFEIYRRSPSRRNMGTGRDLTARHRSGTEFPVEVALSHFESDEGPRYIAVVSDITGRKRAEDALRQTNAQLEEFSYVASHDLRSPLRGIAELLGWIQEELEPAQLTAAVRQNFERASIRIQRCERMIEDLLDYARAGKREAKTQLLEPQQAVDDALKMVEQRPGFIIETDIQSAPFVGHAPPLTLCLRNLIGNALKHHGGEQGVVRIAARDSGRFAVFTIEDNGQGIPENAAERIFKLFHRANAAAAGHGIGLAVTRRMVNAHGGTIVVEKSPALGGACFRFSWPRVLMKDDDND